MMMRSSNNNNKEGKGGDLSSRMVVVQKNQSSSWMTRMQSLKKGSGHDEVVMCSNNNNNGCGGREGGGEMVDHFSHPGHRLLWRKLGDQAVYMCSGCKEYGAGNRYSCSECDGDFQLHEFCAALSPRGLKSHPFHPYGGHHLLLFDYSSSSASCCCCDVCSVSINGFGFRCGVCTNFQMHPCCAMLSIEMNLPTSLHPHGHLKMVTTSSSSSVDHHHHQCGECGNRIKKKGKKKKKRSSAGEGRVYRCTVCDYEVHALCVKNLINGLNGQYYNKGIISSDHMNKKKSMLGTVGRLASQVVVEFLGGIIEGIGEGVGEAFVQNINPKAAPPPPPPPHPPHPPHP